MTCTSPDLPVPAEVLRHRAVACGWITVDDTRTIGAAMVAAELRRLVAEQGGMNRGGDLVIDATVLTDRADELDPEETP